MIALNTAFATEVDGPHTVEGSFDNNGIRTSYLDVQLHVNVWDTLLNNMLLNANYFLNIHLVGHHFVAERTVF